MRAAPLLSLALVLVCGALLVACSALPELPERAPLGPLPGGGPELAPVSAERLDPLWSSAAARSAIAARIWDLIERRFYDPFFNGVDWHEVRSQMLPRAAAAASDQALYLVLKELAAATRDSHTLVLTPREATDARDFVSARIGARLVAVGDAIAVGEVEPGSAAQRSGVLAGDLVVAIDGQRLDEEFFASSLADPLDVRQPPRGAAAARRWQRMRAVAALLHHAPDATATVVLRLQGGDGRLRDVELTYERSARAPRVGSVRFDDGIVLLRIDRFQPGLRVEIVHALDAAATAPAIVLDLRGNGGGSFDLYGVVAGRLMPQRQLALYLIRRTKPGALQTSVAELWLGGASDAIARPLAILVDGRTASAAELLAITLAENGGALLVGEPTCGCAVGVQTEVVLPDGGALRIAQTGFRSAHGRRLEGDPIVPQFTTLPQLRDLRDGRDVALDQALAVLRRRLADLARRRLGQTLNYGRPPTIATAPRRACVRASRTPIRSKPLPRSLNHADRLVASIARSRRRAHLRYSGLQRQ